MERTIATVECDLLARFNQAGVLTPADVHVASRVAKMVNEARAEARLVLALVVKAIREGSVCVDVDTLPTAPTDSLAQNWDISSEQWPSTDWVHVLETSPLTTLNPPVLHLDGRRVYAQRYWVEETQVLHQLLARLTPLEDIDGVWAVVEKYFPDPTYADQARAAYVATTRNLAIITGGPGSGKTTTLARMLGIWLERDPHVRVGLAAPTGKAVARMAQALGQATAQDTFPGEYRERITAIPATTVHRLLGYTPGGQVRYNKHNPLPYEVVVVDEASMVSLPLMARLFDALRPHTRVVLVGDGHQLASVEAGAVFADLVQGFTDHPQSPVVKLGPSRRFGLGIHTLAQAVRNGDQAGLNEVLHNATGVAGVTRIGVGELTTELQIHAEKLARIANDGDAQAALELLQAQQVLCAHRDGPYGVRVWNQAMATHLNPGGEHWFVGQPVLVTHNDHALRLFNGDHGVVINRGDRLVVAFDQGEGIREVGLSQLSHLIPAYAMTVHRAQGSQFETVSVVLPHADSPLLTRELIYTAITRASQTVRLVGSEESLRVGVAKRVQRASGLVERLGGLPLH
ncbi:MAG TPA: exodeoxyribonuclease V subunit alpha [Beutenbergiaceae bacterium]|nr:exodeoxyribonuclease V subunit alpha [Beutenbergiaceae bacterium]